MNIFPCNADKSPRTSNGLYDARPETEWAEDAPLWGAPTGETNGFVVVDFDLKGNGLDTFAQFNWGDTLVVDTPSGGKHVYYSLPKGLKVGNRVKFLPGTDFRGDGGYVCLYEDITDAHMEPLPGWVLTLVQQKEKRLADFQAGEVAEGGRNAYLTRVAGRMQRQDILTVAALDEKNQKDCNPPLDISEVEAIVESVSRYAPDPVETGEGDDHKVVWVSEMVGDMFEYLRDKGKTLGESTGIEQLDTVLGGGKRLGELTVTMAEAKVGKNTFWHCQMSDILDRGIAIGYASRELSPETEVLPNLLTVKLGKNLYKEDVSEEEVMKAIKTWRLAFAPGYGAFTGDELFNWMDECLLHGVRYFWIDHLHYCLVDSEDFKLLSEFGRRIKTYAKTNMVHIDLIIQPKNVPYIKQGDKLVPQELDIGLLRGGANLGQVLDSLITMTRARDDDGRQMDVVKVELKRARSKLARPGYFHLAYNHDKMTFKLCDDPTGKIREENRVQGTRIVRPAASPPANEDRFFDGAKLAQNMIKRLDRPKPGAVTMNNETSAEKIKQD